MGVKIKTAILISVIFVAVGYAGTLAALTEVGLPNGLVRYVALVLFAGWTAIAVGGLGWFLGAYLTEWSRYHELNKDLVTYDDPDRTFVRSSEKSGNFSRIDQHSVTDIAVVPARRVHPGPLEDAGLDENLYRRLLEGGNSDEHGSKI